MLISSQHLLLWGRIGRKGQKRKKRLAFIEIYGNLQYSSHRVIFFIYTSSFNFDTVTEALR